MSTYSKLVMPVMPMVTSLVLALSAASCAQTQLNQQLDDKLAHTPDIAGGPALHADVVQEIQNSDLPTDQKTKLLDLSGKVSATLDQQREESRKLRALLVLDITQTNYNANEIDLIKSRLKQVENDRLALIFSSIDDFTKIVGHVTTKHMTVFNDMFEPRAHAP